MKTLFILKRDPDIIVKTIMQESEKDSEVIVVDIRSHEDYDAVVASIETCDRLISW